MKNKLFRIICVFCAALTALVLSAPPRALAAAAQRQIVYTALGDSIATGYRLSSKSDSYVSKYGAYLRADVSNLGQNGLTSAGLLTKLTSDSAVIARVKKSDVVTVSIGGNDMLSVFSSLKTDSLSELISSVKAIQSAEMQQKFSAGVAQFGSNWDKIVARIHSLAPHAVIIVTTLVNPYRGIVITIPFASDFDLGSFGDKYITKINAVITGSAASGGYLAADSFSAFKASSKKLTNADLAKLEFDPHPNKDGHELIYQTHRALKLSLSYGALSFDGPSSVTIPYYSPATDARYSVKPALTCFGSGYTAAYMLADGGDTGATFDPASGVLNVKRPGSVKLTVTVTSAQAGITASATRTVSVVKATKQSTNMIMYISAAAGALILAALVAALVALRRRRRR
jgi:lysophospholipase L1-like esterase